MSNQLQISLIGLGYVGLPIAVAFAEAGINVIGFDVNTNKIELYKRGLDPTNEVGSIRLKAIDNVLFTNNPEDLRKASFHIVSVPTPVKDDNTPDLEPIIIASEILGKMLKKRDIVVYESTVYPGVTEEICLPILEKHSNMICGVDFKVGYSPERINPGDKEHGLKSIVKIVSGIDQESLEIIAKVYSIVVEAGVYKAPSIKVAEAAKVIENSQRDINIAFMNELALIFDKMKIDTKEVLNAARTKWNFLNFEPGLVGGHCIGVDPYYLTHKAERCGYTPEVILAGRKINDQMGKYIAEKIVKKMINQGINIRGSKVAILGFTFKENCPDTRNTKVYDIISELNDYGVEIIVADYQADNIEAKHEYGINIVDIENIENVDAVIIAVSHDQYKNISVEEIKNLYKIKNKKNVLMDIKGILDKTRFETEFDYWRL